MNTYGEKLKELEASQCKVCLGTGECDDSEPGDISFNSHICKVCKGLGINNYSDTRDNLELSISCSRVIVIRESNVDHFEKRVNMKLKDGWGLQGSMCVENMFEVVGDISTGFPGYIQMVIKES